MKNIFLAFLMIFGVSLSVQAQVVKAPVERTAENVTEKKAPKQAEPAAADSNVSDEDKAPKEGPVMYFETLTLDYGTIEQNSDKVRFFKFKNTGTEPLVISNARGSCGCTVPEWPKAPIMPGQEDVIKVSYATNRLGKINKTITLTTNEEGKPHVIKVVGEVLKKEEGLPEAPKNILEGGN